ncbi:unnamed protein product [Ambrosiozyma monospora]|uniref:Unnamed protein product n=1 Tax=Ambrosiozyma monospora TaxID=43982 RepID=A0ACB5T4C0_AMBMO|nr:unnamed protein product [Ambrosiozyma monospora]
MSQSRNHVFSDNDQENQHDHYKKHAIQTQETTCKLPSLSKPIEETESNEPNKLHQYLPDYGKYALFRKPFLLKLTFIVILISIANTAQGYITALLNICQMQPAFLHYTGNPTGAVLGAINTAPELGGMITLGLASHLSDTLGRRTPLIIGSVFVLIAVVLQSCAQNYAMFLIGGLFNGFGGSIGQVAATSLVSEVSYPPYRQVMSVICSTSWFMGANLAAWIGYGVKDVTGN